MYRSRGRSVWEWPATRRGWRRRGHRRPRRRRTRARISERATESRQPNRRHHNQERRTATCSHQPPTNLCTVMVLPRAREAMHSTTDDTATQSEPGWRTSSRRRPPRRRGARGEWRHHPCDFNCFANASTCGVDFGRSATERGARLRGSLVRALRVGWRVSLQSRICCAGRSTRCRRSLAEVRIPLCGDHDLPLPRPLDSRGAGCFLLSSAQLSEAAAQ